MFRIRISVPTLPLNENLKRAVHSAMRIGADGVQFDLRHEIRARDFGETARRELLHSLSEHDLTAASAHFPLRGALLEPDRMDERIAAIHDCLELAAKLRIRLLTLRIGRLPTEESATTSDVLLPVLNDLAARGNHLGVLPCLIPCGDSAVALRVLIDSVSGGPLGIDADLAGWVLNRQSPVKQLRELHDLVRHIQIRDAVADLDGPGKEVPVGRGEIDWDEIAGLLGEMDYTGWLHVTRTAGSDIPGDISRGVQYLRNLIPSTD